MRFPAAGSGTACPFRIDTVSRGNGQALEGPITGGTTLHIVGSRLHDDPTDVLIAGQKAEIGQGGFVISDDGTTTAVDITTPPVDRPMTAEIHVRNRAGEVVAPVTFRYVATEQSTDSTGQSTDSTGQATDTTGQATDTTG